MFLVDEMCSRIDVSKINAAGRDQINTELTKLGEEIRADYGDKNEQIMAMIREQNPNYSEAKVEGTFLLSFLELALDSCDKYGEVIVLAVGDCPPGNDALEAINTDIEGFLEKKKGSPYMSQYLDVMNKIDKVLKSHEDLVIENYAGGLDDEKLINDVIIYLSYKSKQFLKVIVIGQIEMGLSSE